MKDVVTGVPLWGQVLGPGGLPLAGAAVEVPALQLFTSADASGRFRFANVPARPPPRLVVRAKGLVQTFAVSMNGSLSEVFGPLSPAWSSTWVADIWNVTVAQIAPIMPYVLLVLILALRPMGLLGTRET